MPQRGWPNGCSHVEQLLDLGRGYIVVPLLWEPVPLLWDPQSPSAGKNSPSLILFSGNLGHQSTC